MRQMAVVIVALVASALVAVAQGSQSEPVARQLAQLMREHKLEAFATKDPSKPNEYVAALLVPDVQLLVVAGEPTAQAAIVQQLAEKRYMDAYTTLQQAVVP